ncbi:MAG: sigma-70 family RNA polymerase sigma factor [Pseudomonadota bacterium]
MPDNEPALIAAAKDGSHAAFCQLAMHYRDRLLRFLVARGVNRADAEDAAQDALVNAWRYLASYDARWQFSTWLYRIALRKLPRARNATHVELTGDEMPVDDASQAIETDNLWKLADQHLNDDAANALWLRYAETLSIKEVAHAMQRSQAWVKVSLMRSRRTLSQVVERTMI